METTERGVRRDTVASPVYRVFLDLLAQQVSREHQVSLDQAAKGGHLDQSDPQERKGTSGRTGRWDHLEAGD